MSPDQLFLFTSEKIIQLILALAAAKGLFVAHNMILIRHNNQILLLIICLGLTSEKFGHFIILAPLQIETFARNSNSSCIF